MELIKQLDPICDSGNFMLCDASGQMVVVKISPDKRFVRQSEKERIISINFHASGQIEHREDLEHLRKTQQRYRVIENMLDQEQPTFDTIKNILSTHESNGPVCRHPQCEEIMVLSWIATPTSGQFLPFEGLSCKNEYRIYQLKK
jgi:hypothetical protein